MTTVDTPLQRARALPTRQLLLAALPGILLITLVLVISVRQPTFLSPISLRTIAASAAPIALIALGQTFVILTGGIDLSIAVLTSFGTVLLATWMDDLGGFAVLAMVVAITSAGLLNGFITAYAQVPSFVVTLGAMGLWSGVALAVSGASAVTVGENYPMIGWLTGTRVGGVALSVYVTLALAILIALAFKNLARGKSLHAIGLAESAALMSGVRTRHARLLAFGASGFCAALAAIVLTSSQYSGSPTLADALLLPAIAAVVVGGTAITGGIGGPMRTIIGALVIAVLRVGMRSLGVDPAWEQVVYGAVIIAAVALTLDRKRIGIVK